MTNCSARYNYTKKIRLSRLFYYLLSLIRIFLAVKPGFIISFTSQLITGSIKKVFLKEYNLQFHLLTLLDLLTLKEVVIDREYESMGVAIEKKDKIIIDIGAGFGDFSILSAKMNPDAKIYAFEPDQRYFQLLKENIILNQVNNTIPIDRLVHSLKQLFIQSNPIQSNPIQSNPIQSNQIKYLLFNVIF